MSNSETAQRGPKASVRSHSSREQEDDLRAWITPRIRKIARQRRHEVVSDDYDVDQDLADLEDIGERFRKAEYKAFEYLVMTPIRAKANGESETLLSRLREHLDVKKRKDQTIYHLLTRVYLGFKEPATVSMWARAAEYTVAHLHTDETVREFLKRMGGIRACADAARDDDNAEGDNGEEESDSRKPKPKLNPKARAKKPREAMKEHREGRRPPRSMPASSYVNGREWEEGISPDLDEEYFDGDDERNFKAKLSEDARDDIEEASDGDKGVAYIICRGDVVTIRRIALTDDAKYIVEQAR